MSHNSLLYHTAASQIALVYNAAMSHNTMLYRTTASKIALVYNAAMSDKLIIVSYSGQSNCAGS
jgi:hypothetical protein